MKKMPTLFERDETLPGRQVKPVVKVGCEWVLAGEGTPTRKLDGTNCKIINGVLYKRQKPASGEYDEASYVEAKRDDSADKWLFDAFDKQVSWLDGIYECIGPKIQGNPEKCGFHDLCRVCPPDVGLLLLADVPRTFEGLRDFLAAQDIEGIVFHRDPSDPDCDKVKIKGRDYGLRRPK